MTYRQEFPDFDAATLPPIPAEWDDTSWHNDSCPSFQTPDQKWHVYVDYADAAQRVYEGAKRFFVYELDDDGSFKTDLPVLDTDEWAEVLALVSGADQ